MKDFQKYLLLAICLWMPLSASAQGKHRTTFVITSIPKHTPHDAKLYLSGEFCGWFPDVEECRFTRNGNQYILVMEHEEPSFDYKVTRGTWDAVEARPNGRALPNRHYDLTVQGKTVELQIAAWEDTEVGSYNIYMYFLLLVALQGFLLVLAINSLKKRNKKANATLGLMLLLISLALLSRALPFHPAIFNWQPKLVFIPELLLFAFGPIYCLYIHQLLRIPLRYGNWYVIHFTPMVIQLLMFLPYLAMEEQTLTYRLMDLKLNPIFAAASGVAFLFNSAYWFYARRIIKTYKNTGSLNDQQRKYINFLHSIQTLLSGYLILWLGIISLFSINHFFVLELMDWVEYSTDVLWLLFSFIVFALAYFAVKHPELLRQNQSYANQTMDQDENTKILHRLTSLMENEHIYKEPDLTLQELALKIPTSTHTLSRVINQNHNKTFTAYINEYRIQAFVDQVQQSQGEQSFLSLAYEAGFNSKATFNRAFKKKYDCSPRDFFSQITS